MCRNTSAFSSAERSAESNLVRLVIGAVLAFLGTFLPKTFAKRIVAVILLAMETPVQRIQVLLDMGKSTVYNLKKELTSASSSEEVIRLFQMKPGCGRKLKTATVLEEIRKDIDHGFYTCLREIRTMIRDKYSIALSLASTQRLMTRFGIRRLKSASLPANADPSAQEQFYNNVLQPLMQNAADNKLVLLFMDGSHFVSGCDFLGYVYGTVRRFVRSLSGRQRYNILGALDYVTKKVHTVTNTTFLTATQVIEMLHKLADYYGEGKPIRILLDNARYQKCKAVCDAMAELKVKHDIDLVYFPPYSPNLNLIERIWRYVKSEIRSSFITDFTAFCTRIDAVIDTTTGSAKKQIDSLIGQKVQLYNSLTPVDSHTFVMPSKKNAA